MHILLIIDNLGPGGAQRQIVTLALGLRAHHQVEFFIYQPQYDHYRFLLDNVGIVVHEYPKKSRYSFSPIFNLHRLLISGQYDLALSFLDTPNFYAEIAGLGLRIPIVISERSTYRENIPSQQKLILEQFHRLSKGIVVNSHYQAERMLFFHPWMKKQLHVIYNGLDLNRFQPGLNRSKIPNTLLCVGSVSPVKNSLSLAHALAIYRSAYGMAPNVHWYGEVYADSQSQLTYRQTQKYLEEQQLQDCWQWCGTVMNMEEIYPRYQVLIHPSYFEGLSNAIMEAMACGLPVLASNICENPRLIQEQENGFLFEPDNPVGMAKVIHRFFNLDNYQLQQIEQITRQRAENLFSMDTYVSRFSLLFESLL